MGLLRLLISLKSIHLSLNPLYSLYWILTAQRYVVEHLIQNWHLVWGQCFSLHQLTVKRYPQLLYPGSHLLCPGNNIFCDYVYIYKKCPIWTGKNLYCEVYQHILWIKENNGFFFSIVLMPWCHNDVCVMS